MDRNTILAVVLSAVFYYLPAIFPASKHTESLKNVQSVAVESIGAKNASPIALFLMAKKNHQCHKQVIDYEIKTTESNVSFTNVVDLSTMLIYRQQSISIDRCSVALTVSNMLLYWPENGETRRSH